MLLGFSNPLSSRNTFLITVYLRFFLATPPQQNLEAASLPSNKQPSGKPRDTACPRHAQELVLFSLQHQLPLTWLSRTYRTCRSMWMPRWRVCTRVNKAIMQGKSRRSLTMTRTCINPECLQVLLSVFSLTGCSAVVYFFNKQKQI